MSDYTSTGKVAREEDLSPDEKRILLLTSPCHFLTHMFILVFPAATMPIVNALGMPLENVVRLSFLMYLVYGVGALPAGYIADRWQARRLIIYGVYAMGTGLFLAGLFPSPGPMTASLLLVGIGASIYHPAGLALISRTVERRGHALAINGVFGNFGIAAAPLVTGILTWLFSWQTAFMILGAAGVLTGAVLGRIRVDETIRRRSETVVGTDEELAKYFIILCVGLVFAGLAYRGNMVLLPAYLELKTSFFRSLLESLSFIKTQGAATLAATILASVVSVMGVFGQLMGGKLADRFDLRRAYLAVHAMSLPFILAMAFTTDYLLVVCAGFYVMFSLGMQPIENSLIASLTPPRWRSTSFAIKFILNFGLGAAVVYMIGFVKTRSSLEGVYVFLAAITLLLVLCVIGLNLASRSIRDIRN